MGRRTKIDLVPLNIEKMPAARSRQGQWKQSKNAIRPFIAWDGEAVKDGGYCLFGNSMGMLIERQELNSIEMLELLLEAGERYPDGFHIGFSFYYDVNNVLKDMSRLHWGVLHRLGHVTWNGYRIEHIPNKIFKVQKGERKIKVEDIFHFFRTRYDKALIEYSIGTKEEQESITAGKDAREDFWWKNINDIRYYWGMELRLMVALMDELRSRFNAAGFYVGEWYGPGALAKYALRNHGMGKFKRETPKEIEEAVLAAYAGGWFERFKAGYHDGKVYTADLNSAYVWAASLLPNLAVGVWRRIEKPDPNLARTVRFGVFRIRYINRFGTFMATSHGVPLPLFQRRDGGGLSHPVATEGWFWNPEAELVIGHPEAEFLEAWIFDDDGTYPFAWVSEMYTDRARLKAMGNQAHIAFKMALASVYGAFAQRVGWDEKNNLPPKWHQIEWAGWITSKCRAMIFRAALPIALKNGLVSIDTDGITSLLPFNATELQNGVGAGLGQWELEEFEGMVYIQNGVYWMKGGEHDKRSDEDGWVPPKLRGLPKGNKVKARQAIEALEGDGVVRLTKKNFVGYGAALQGDWGDWRTWKEGPYDINVHKAGNRQHVRMLCRACARGYEMSDCLHDLALVPSPQLVSAVHKLPWRDEKKKEEKWEVIRHFASVDDL